MFKEILNGKKHNFRFLNKFGIYIVLIIMIFILSIITDTFFTFQNIVNVLRQISINGILAIGVTLIIITGGIDLSLGSILAFSGVVSASLAHPEPHYSLFIIILTSIIVGAVCGAVNGALVAFFRVPPFIATLGMMTIARGAALVFTKGRPVIGLSCEFKVIGQGLFLQIPIPIFILLFITIIGGILLHKVRFGRYVYAIGGNIEAAKTSGVNVRNVIFNVYLFGGALCGIAGVLLASRTNAGSPAAGTGYELDAIAAAVLGGTSTAGGKGTIAGTIAGVMIIGILSNGLDILNISSYIQQIVKGMIIVSAVLIDQYSESRR